MHLRKIHNVLTYCIAAVWIANGLFCKVLHLVPRHEQIVERILGGEHASSITVLIGLSEIAMAIWLLSKFKARLNAIAQIIIITTMNILEFILAPDLLLWGVFNLLFAVLFIVIIYLNEFVLRKKINQQV